MRSLFIPGLISFGLLAAGQTQAETVPGSNDYPAPSGPYRHTEQTGGEQADLQFVPLNPAQQDVNSTETALPVYNAGQHAATFKPLEAPAPGSDTAQHPGQSGQGDINAVPEMLQFKPTDTADVSPQADAVVTGDVPLHPASGGMPADSAAQQMPMFKPVEEPGSHATGSTSADQMPRYNDVPAMPVYPGDTAADDRPASSSFTPAAPFAAGIENSQQHAPAYRPENVPPGYRPPVEGHPAAVYPPGDNAAYRPDQPTDSHQGYPETGGYQPAPYPPGGNATYQPNFPMGDQPGYPDAEGFQPAPYPASDNAAYQPNFPMGGQPGYPEAEGFQPAPYPPRGNAAYQPNFPMGGQPGYPEAEGFQPAPYPPGGNATYQPNFPAGAQPPVYPGTEGYPYPPHGTPGYYAPQQRPPAQHYYRYPPPRGGQFMPGRPPHPRYSAHPSNDSAPQAHREVPRDELFSPAYNPPVQHEDAESFAPPTNNSGTDSAVTETPQ